MARNPKQPLQTKKHLARQERESIQRRYLLIAAGVIFALIIGVIIFGVLNETVLKSRQPVLIVNGDTVSTHEFQVRTRYLRQQMISNAASTFQFLQVFGDSPEARANVANQLTQIQAQLEPPTTMGRQVIDQLTDELLIRQEAERRGITVTDEEIEQTIQDAFGYFPNGTPTSAPTLEVLPTSTLSSQQMTLVPPTATATATAAPTEVITPTAVPTQTATATLVPSITPTSVPTLTPTPYTEEGYQEQYDQTVGNLSDSIGFTESDLRDLVASQLYRQKVQEAVLEELDVPRTEEQVWARHILVEDEAAATEIRAQLDEGADFCELAAENSTDTTNASQCGDLGWFGRNRMVVTFEQVAFAMQPGQISQPVETDFGFHIIQVLGHEDRPLSPSGYQQEQQTAFDNWLQELRDAAETEIRDYWQERVPGEPRMPLELLQFMQQEQAAQQQPIIPTLEVQQ